MKRMFRTGSANTRCPKALQHRRQSRRPNRGPGTKQNVRGQMRKKPKLPSAHSPQAPANAREQTFHHRRLAAKRRSLVHSKEGRPLGDDAVENAELEDERAWMDW